MTVYIWILIWVALCAVFVSAMSRRKQELAYGGTEERVNWLSAFIIMLPLIFMTGFRDPDFGDTWAYKIGFENVPIGFSNIRSYLDDITKDKGFYLFTFFVKQIAYDNDNIYFLVIATIQVLILVWFFRNHSSNYVLSVFLFVASADYLCWMFNGVRQFMAVTIVLLATPFLLRKKYFWFILIILLASTFHQSALIMIPLGIIAIGEAGNSRTIIFILFIIIAIFSIDRFTNILDNFLVDTQYGNVVSDYISMEDDGTNPIRVLVYSVPAIFALFGIRFIKQENNHLINFCVNMSIISSGLYIVSMLTSGIFLGRLPIYASLYGYILLPWEIKMFFDKKYRWIIYVIMIVLYLAYYYYQTNVAWTILFRS